MMVISGPNHLGLRLAATEIVLTLGFLHNLKIVYRCVLNPLLSARLELPRFHWHLSAPAGLDFAFLGLPPRSHLAISKSQHAEPPWGRFLLCET